MASTSGLTEPSAHLGTSRSHRRKPAIGQFVHRVLASHTALVRFALVGGGAYLIYQTLLFLIYDSELFWFMPAKKSNVVIIFFEHADVRFLIATLLSSAVTLVAHFIVHDLWTFRDRTSVRKPLWMRFGQFLATVLIAVGIVTLMVNLLTVQFGIHYALAVPIGVGFAGIWNWLWSSRFVWRRASRNGARS